MNKIRADLGLNLLFHCIDNPVSLLGLNSCLYHLKELNCSHTCLNWTESIGIGSEKSVFVKGKNKIENLDA